MKGGHVGTTGHIRWTTVALDQVVITYPDQNGAAGSWENVAMVKVGDPGWGDFEWTVADASSTACVIYISGYMGEAGTQSGVFEIRAVTGADGDGMDDAWELAVFGDTSRDGTGDADDDGWTDYEEFVNGTDPLVADAAAALGFGCTPVGSYGGSLFLLLGTLLLARRGCR